MTDKISNELNELKQKRTELNQEISKKELQGFKNRFKQMSFLEKVIFLLGFAVVFFISYFFGVALASRL